MKDRMIVLRLSVVAVVFLMISGRGLGRVDSPQDGNKLNVILITIDTLRADKLGCYGNAVIPTPNIDDFAKKSVLFSRAFAHNPMTLPSHTNIMLGTTAPYHGVHDNVNFIVRDEFLTMAEHLKTYGYSTGAVIGAASLDSRLGLNQGFDYYEDDLKTKGKPKNTSAERRGDEVVSLSKNWISGRSGPFFLWMHVFDPHFPYTPPEPFKSRYPNKPYDGEVAYTDSLLGEFFRFIEAQGLTDRTLVILTADHGESLGEHGEVTHGMFAYNSTIWIPLIIHHPNIKPLKNRQLVGHFDLFPTVCDLIGADVPPEVQGISLKPALLGKKIPSRTLYFESLEPYYCYGWGPIRGYIDNAKKFMDSPIPEVYDLNEDFGEKNNLIADFNLSKYQSQLKKLMEGLSHPETNESSRQVHDQKTIEKLKTLGYVNFSSFPGKNEKFGPGDDVKKLLPVYNESMDAMILAEEGKSDAAISALRKLISRKVRIYQPYIFLADILDKANRRQEAIEVLVEADRKFPNSYGIIERYLRLLVARKEYDKAVEVFRSSELIQLDQEPRLWYSLGLALLGKRDFTEAIKALTQAVTIDTRFSDGFAILGKAQLLLSIENEDMNAYASAVRNAQTALSFDPEHSQALFTLGLAEIQSGEFEIAVKNFKKSLMGESPDPKIYYHLALCYLNLKQYSQAVDYFTRFRNDYYPFLTPDEKKDLEVYLKRGRDAIRR